MKNIFLSIIVLILLTGCYSPLQDKSEISYSWHRLNTGSSKSVMPEIDSLPQYKDIYHHYRIDIIFIWEMDTLLLVVTYDQDTYLDEKAKLDDTFYFLNEPNSYVSDQIFPQTTFSVGDFDFRIISDDQGYGDYPHDFGMIAVSDTRNSIAYLYLYDFNLDSVGDSFSEFVSKYFPYKW